MLIDLKTRLKDLKFGNDQFGYGSSNEPYIQTPIPGTARSQLFGPDALIYAATSKGGLDYPSRGGAPYVTLGFQTISQFNIIDQRRIQKFLESSPKGTLFIEKQIGLQLSNPKTEVATSITGPSQFGPLEITRLYQSSNTLEQVKNQGSGAHGRRHGLNAFTTYQNNYFNTVNKQNIVPAEEGKLDNRLLNLYSLKIYSGNNSNPQTIPNSIVNLDKIFKTGIDQYQKNILFRYSGGPGSIYGIGETTIHRTEDTTKLGSTIFSHIGKKVMTYDKIRAQDVNKGVGESSKQKVFPENRVQDFRKQTYSPDQRDYIPWEDWNPLGTVPKTDTVRVGSSVNDTYNNLKRKGYEKIAERGTTFIPTSQAPKINRNNLTDFRQNPRWNNEDSIDSKFYFTYESPINPGKWNRYDKINSSYPFDFDNSSEPWTLNGKDSKDMIKFVFEAIDNTNSSLSTAILFRAFLKGNITDNHSGQWNGFNYFGRGEKFYTYQGFDRTIGFSFTVPIFSRVELQPVYNRLNALVSQVYPDYSSFGLMRAPIIRLTIGDYIYRMAGFLENVNLTLSGDGGWEIEDGVQLPMIVEVQTSFKPIPDDLPKRYNRNSVSRLMIQRPDSIINKEGKSVTRDAQGDVNLGDSFTSPVSTLPVSSMYTVSASSTENANGSIKIEKAPDNTNITNTAQKKYYYDVAKLTGIVDDPANIIR